MKNSSLFHDLIRRIQNCSPERTWFLKELGQQFRILYTDGVLDYLCKVNITDGHADFRHDTSTNITKSGLKIVLDKAIVKNADIREISQCLLSDKQIIKILMFLGFDTLVVSGREEKTSVLYCIRDYERYSTYILD